MDEWSCRERYVRKNDSGVSLRHYGRVCPILSSFGRVGLEGAKALVVWLLCINSYCHSHGHGDGNMNHDTEYV